MTTARPLSQTRNPGRSLSVITGTRAGRPVIAPWVVFSLVVVLALFGLVLSRTTLDEGAYELAELTQEIAEAQTQNQRLRLEVARLESPARIAPAAAELGLVYPTERLLMTVPGVVAQSSDSDPRWATLDRYASEAHGGTTP